jgi:O-antigen/teichoic acid export membrane protein
MTRLFASVAAQWSARLFTIIGSTLLTLWAAQYFGPSVFGQLNYAVAFVGLLAPLGGLGSINSLRVLRAAPNPIKGLTGSAFLLQLIGSFLLSVISVGAAILFTDTITIYLILFLLVANYISSFNVLEVELLADNAGNRLALADLLKTIITVSCGICLILIQAPLLLYAALPILSNAVRSLCLIFFWSPRKFLLSIRHSNLQTIKELLFQGWTITLSWLAISLYTKSDKIMIGWFLSSSDVGIYSLADQAVTANLGLILIFINTFYQRFATSINIIVSDSEARCNREVTQSAILKLRKFRRVILLIGLLLSAMTGLIMPKFMLFLGFGDQYVRSIELTYLLSPMCFLFAINRISNAWLSIKNCQQCILLSSSIGAIANIGLNVLFIPNFGISGAAYATLLSLSIDTVVVRMIHSNESRASLLWLSM